MKDEHDPSDKELLLSLSHDEGRDDQFFREEFPVEHTASLSERQTIRKEGPKYAPLSPTNRESQGLDKPDTVGVDDFNKTLSKGRNVFTEDTDGEEENDLAA